MRQRQPTVLILKSILTRKRCQPFLQSPHKKNTLELQLSKQFPMPILCLENCCKQNDFSKNEAITFFFTCGLPLQSTVYVFNPFLSRLVYVLAQNWKHWFIDSLKEKANLTLFTQSWTTGNAWSQKLYLKSVNLNIFSKNTYTSEQT